MSRTNDSSSRSPKNHIDRADPNGRLRETIEHVQVLKDPLVRGLLKVLGAPPTAIDRMVEVSEELRRLVGAYARWVPLVKLGWAITDAANEAVYDRALQALDEGEPDNAESVLEEFWNEGDRLEKVLVLRALRVAVCSEIRMRVGRERLRILQLAAEDHRAGRYHASIPVVLAQMEGMLRDTTRSSPFQSLTRLVDDETQGGHPEILRELFALGSMKVERTYTELGAAFPPRHGVLHGRDLGYATRRNSTKVFVAMAELATFCRARILEAQERGILEALDRRVFGESDRPARPYP